MESPEVPLESSQEAITHHASHAGGQRWILGVALTAALLAVCAAIAALMAEHCANEAMIEQIQCSDQWNFYQAKGIKANVLATKMELRRDLGKAEDAEDASQLKEYRKEQRAIKKEAKDWSAESAQHLQVHHALAPAVTMFQVAIAVSAISVLTGRKWFWLVSIVFGLVGVGFLVKGILLTTAAPVVACVQLTLLGASGILLR